MMNYTKAEDHFIEKNYLNISDEVIAAHIGRSASGIRKRRWVLRLGKTHFVGYQKRSKVHLKVKALAWSLKVSGRSYLEVAKEVGHPKSTVIKWCKLFMPYTGPNKEILTLKSKI